MIGNQLTLRDQMFKEAANADALLADAKEKDPIVYNLLAGKATNAAATQLGSVFVAGLSLVVTHYGFGWSDQTITFIAGTAAFVTGYAIHWIQVKMNSLSANPTPVIASKIS
jgi:hypothetical protein